MSDQHRIKIVSDGYPMGTHVFVDGKEIEARSVEFKIGVDHPAIATLEVYVDEIEVEGDIPTVLGKLGRTP